MKKVYVIGFVLVGMFLWGCDEDNIEGENFVKQLEYQKSEINILKNEIVILKASIEEAQYSLKKVSCDLPKAFAAERRYTYPILRDLGYNPDDYGKGYNNPTMLYLCEENNK